MINQIRDIDSTRRLGSKQAKLITMHAQLGILDKDRAPIKGLVVCFVVLLGSMKGMVLGLAQGAWVGQDGYRAQVPQQHPIAT